MNTIINLHKFQYCLWDIQSSTFASVTAWKLSVFEVFLALIFPHSDWMQRDTLRYSVFLRILYECGKIRTRNTLNTDTFHAERSSNWLIRSSDYILSIFRTNCREFKSRSNPWKIPIKESFSKVTSVQSETLLKHELLHKYFKKILSYS